MKLFVIGLFFGFWTLALSAAESCRLTSWSDISAAVLRTAPDFLPLQKKQDVDRQQLELAGQKPPARLEGQYLIGSPATREGEGELRYEWTLERGGKREARQRLAQTQWDLSQAAVATKQADVLRDLAITADRLEQIRHEDDVLQETVSTYRALIKQYGARAALSPEQDVTLAVFKLARDETLLKSGELQVEAEAFRSQLRYRTACPSLTLPREKIKERSVWPEFPERLQEGLSASKKQRDAQRAQAKARLEQEQSATTADIAVGPMARWNREDGDNALSFGLAASLPLGAGASQANRQLAQATYEFSEAEAVFDEQQRAADYARWLSQYRLAREVLRQGFAETDVRLKHERLEQVFLAGRVSAPLVIEAHRQMYEHLVSRHQIEMKAVEALWNLRSLTGQMRQGDL